MVLQKVQDVINSKEKNSAHEKFEINGISNEILTLQDHFDALFHGLKQSKDQRPSQLMRAIAGAFALMLSTMPQIVFTSNSGLVLLAVGSTQVPLDEASTDSDAQNNTVNRKGRRTTDPKMWFWAYDRYRNRRDDCYDRRENDGWYNGYYNGYRNGLYKYDRNHYTIINNWRR